MGKELAFDAEITEQIVKLRSEGKKWDEIGEAMDMAPGKAMLIFSASQISKKDLIKNATAADVKRLRDEENLSWGDIMVRTLMTESGVRSLYREAGGDDKGHRIGKGGRHPGSGAATGEPRAPRAAKAKADDTPAVDLLADLDEAGIKEKLTGYAIKVNLGGGELETLAVREVKKAAKGKVVLVDAKTGATRTIKNTTITLISKKKVNVS